MKPGESVSVNGVCLTAAAAKKPAVTFDLMPETLKRTNLGLLRKNDKVNIERSMKFSDRNSGHFVMGHVDDVGMITERKDSGDFTDMRIKCDKEIMPYIEDNDSWDKRERRQGQPGNRHAREVCQENIGFSV